MKTYNEAQLAEITAIQEKSNITRKSAIRKFEKSGRKIVLTTGFTQKNAGVTVTSNLQPAVNPASAANTIPVSMVDYKAAAANDDTNQPAASPEHAKIALNQAESLTPEARAAYEKQAGAATTPKPEAPKPVVPPTAAGSARAEGIRLYKLSNVATLAKDEGVKTDVLFKHVYGPMGPKWTWEQRAKAVGLTTAEEAAKQFQRMRGGKPQEFVKAEEPKEKK